MSNKSMQGSKTVNTEFSEERHMRSLERDKSEKRTGSHLNEFMGNEVQQNAFQTNGLKTNEFQENAFQDGKTSQGTGGLKQTKSDSDRLQKRQLQKKALQKKQIQNEQARKNTSFQNNLKGEKESFQRAGPDIKENPGTKELTFKKNGKHKKSQYTRVRYFDKKTGEVRYELRPKKVLKKKGVRAKAAASGFMIASAGKGLAHGYVSELEQDNDAVKIAHQLERVSERAGGAFTKKTVKEAKKAVFKIENKLELKKKVQGGKSHSHAMQKLMQKQRIKREYAKAMRKGREAKQAASYAQKAVQKGTAMARKIQEFVRKHIGVIITIVLILILFLLISVGISSCAAVFSGGTSTFLAGSYQSKPAEIDAAEESLALKEIELEERINGIEEEYPDYDEYNYNIAEIGHSPFVLINYLSSVYKEIKADEVSGEIDALFDEMYELTLTSREETRTRTVTKTRYKTDPDTGEILYDEVTGEALTEEYEEEEEYTVKILDVTLESKNLADIVEGRLSGNEEAVGFYETYQNTNGLLQEFYSPLKVDWYKLISSNYGSRLDPFTGARQFHRGLDIAVPEGTDVYAAMSGTVAIATYDSGYGNYVVIEDENGYVTKYAHMSSLSVTAGQHVEHGDLIGKTGNTGASTGSHLHIECLFEGEYYNPLFYFANGDGSIYGEESEGGNAGKYSGDVQALITEAEKYLGKPYVWGGSNPQTGFDCSGFVCYVLKQSGYYDISRTTAQGIYDQTSPVSASEARPGDIIFFTGTYDSAGPVSHVGIYTGNGQMIHCGDPISYASINTPYWQSHFYGFGRVGGD